MLYLFRYLPLSELTEIGTLHGQATHLAGWALETWAILDADPPRTQ